MSGELSRADTNRDAAPLAAVAHKALGGVAGLLADGALGAAGQVALAPVMRVLERGQVLARRVGRVLLAVRHRKVLAVHVDEVLAYCKQRPLASIKQPQNRKSTGIIGLTFTVYGRIVVEALPAHVAELFPVVDRLGPAVRHRVLGAISLARYVTLPVYAQKLVAYLDQRCRDARARRDHALDAALVHAEVAN